MRDGKTMSRFCKISLLEVDLEGDKIRLIVIHWVNDNKQWGMGVQPDLPLAFYILLLLLLLHSALVELWELWCFCANIHNRQQQHFFQLFYWRLQDRWVTNDGDIISRTGYQNDFEPKLNFNIRFRIEFDLLPLEGKALLGSSSVCTSWSVLISHIRNTLVVLMTLKEDVQHLSSEH